MKISKILLGLTIFGSISAIIRLEHQYKIVESMVIAYKQISGNDSPPAPNSKPELTPVAKAQIDLLLQQQAQKAFNPPPEDDELSDSEKLQKLNDALHQVDNAEDEYDRELAVMELGELRGAEAKQGIVTALHDNSNLVVTQAIRQIDKWQDPAERTALLLIALQNQNDDIVEQTLLTITEVEDKRLIARLKQLSKHHNPGIRDAAKLALNLAS